MSSGIILLVILVILLLAGLPNWRHSKNWGYGPSGIFGLLVVVVLILILFTDLFPKF